MFGVLKALGSGIAVLIIGGFMSGAPAMPVHAGLLDAVKGVFASETTHIAPLKNSQNMALLSAAINSNPNSTTGGASRQAVGGPALLAVQGSGASLQESEENGDDDVTSDQISVYVVREGDSLSKIAEMFNVTVNTLRFSNDIKGSGIQPGQQLVILPISGVRHTVEEGETLSEIAELYDVKIDDIERFNDIDEDHSLVVGDVITVPDGEKGMARSHTDEQPSPSVDQPERQPESQPSHGGYYARPVSGGVRTQGIHGYNGVDLASGHGTTIRAAAAGQVIISKSSGWNGGYGLYVVVKHDNGTQTLYAHNSRNLVGVGEYVEQGQAIAEMGSTGKSTGTHLHFEVRGARNPF